jgi:negative regulator of genetic competence, sporulation and motility
MFMIITKGNGVGTRRPRKVLGYKPASPFCKSSSADAPPIIREKSYIYWFDDFDEMCSALKMIDKIYFGESTLYKYGDNYVAEFKPYPVTRFINVERILTEFGRKIYLQSQNISGVLKEHAKCLISKDAVGNISNFF